MKAIFKKGYFPMDLTNDIWKKIEDTYIYNKDGESFNIEDVKKENWAIAGKLVSQRSES